MASTPSCVFCEIVAGRAPAHRLAEGREAVAFLTLGPLRKGHAIVVPKRHAVELPEATPSELAEIFQLGAEIARRQRDRLGSEGETLFLASGEAGEQSVRHLHLHVVPRAKGDGIDLTRWWGGRARSASAEELADVARRLGGPA
jgi:histidine triad (HIT) family protein